MWGRPLSILVASFAVGLLQIGLAYAAGVHADLQQGDVHRFGYLRTLHWSLLYTLVIPIILAASVPVALTLYRRSKAGPAYRLRFYILVLGALAFAAGMAGHEGWRAWAPLSGHQEFFQWNSFNADGAYRPRRSRPASSRTCSVPWPVPMSSSVPPCASGSGSASLPSCCLRPGSSILLPLAACSAASI